MKHLYLNLKRFDIPRQYGGVNGIAPIERWGTDIIRETQGELKKYPPQEVEFVQFFPEAHILNAVAACGEEGTIQIGCQGVYRRDVSPGGNFGAFTTSRPAASAKALGCDAVIIGHCEERSDKDDMLSMAGKADPKLVDRIMNEEIKCALAQGLKVLYCVGEKSEEQAQWKEVLRRQLETGLAGVPAENIVIGYEPVWSIGPGRIPADQEYITKVARYIKEVTNGMDVVYGGGLKKENARMLASIQEVDGGLIALTRFQGDIGFYPAEYLEIIRLYLKG